MGLVMNMTTLSTLLILILCSSAVQHEKQKWTVYEEDSENEYVTQAECDEISEEHYHESQYENEDEEVNVEVLVDEFDQEEDEEHVHSEHATVGSVRGTPGVDYPNLSEIPLTKFSCAEQKYIPGFYADLETACQVFHVCYSHRRESFLCPLGTVFNQPILTCDYWYNVKCSLSPQYYDVNAPLAGDRDKYETVDSQVESLVSEAVDEVCEEPEPTEEPSTTETPKVKVSLPTEIPVKHIKPKIVPTKPTVKYTSPKPLKEKIKPVLNPEIDVLKSFLPVKAKVTKLVAKAPVLKLATLPLAKVAASVGKAKLASKPKVVYVPVVKPVEPSKIKLGASIPIVKAKQLKQIAVKPVLNAKAAVKIPKAAKMAVKPLLKYPFKLASKAAHPLVSALTKKQLALNYLKLLKLKKLSKPLLGLKF